MNVYAIVDKVAGSSIHHFFAENKASAARTLICELNNPKSVLHDFPGDYKVVEVAAVPAVSPEAIGCDCDQLNTWYERG